MDIVEVTEFIELVEELGFPMLLFLDMYLIHEAEEQM
ncbi:hypothetical protein HRED_08678 [Candidatus Haloredivivus sp. G17]|nr:hypothetical protein HRED_08678 [Candidatus Haloredivivus sp. G17]